MTVTAQTARSAINAAVAERLGLVLTVYREVPNLPPNTKAGPGKGRVAPYAALFPAAGTTDPNSSLEATPSDFLWSGQITFAAGDSDVLDAVLDEAIPLLNLWIPSIPGLSCGPMRPPQGYSAGSIRLDQFSARDDKYAPPRHYLPTQWQIHVVSA